MHAQMQGGQMIQNDGTRLGRVAENSGHCGPRWWRRCCFPGAEAAGAVGGGWRQAVATIRGFVGGDAAGGRPAQQHTLQHAQQQAHQQHVRQHHLCQQVLLLQLAASAAGLPLAAVPPQQLLVVVSQGASSACCRTSHWPRNLVLHKAAGGARCAACPPPQREAAAAATAAPGRGDAKGLAHCCHHGSTGCSRLLAPPGCRCRVNGHKGCGAAKVRGQHLQQQQRARGAPQAELQCVCGHVSVCAML